MATKPCDCGHPPTPRKDGSITTSYGTDAFGKTHCFECCSELDKEALRRMQPGEWASFLYLLPRQGTHMVGNWPGSLRIEPDKIVNNSYRTRHAFQGRIDRLDVWFTFEGRRFWGFSAGDNDILRIRRLK